jgi:hypothetical protein
VGLAVLPEAAADTVQEAPVDAVPEGCGGPLPCDRGPQGPRAAAGRPRRRLGPPADPGAAAAGPGEGAPAAKATRRRAASQPGRGSPRRRPWGGGAGAEKRKATQQFSVFLSRSCWLRRPPGSAPTKDKFRASIKKADFEAAFGRRPGRGTRAGSGPA